MKIPNFLIVGAPKCGTTALSEFLRSHPNVFVSTPKEPMFFCKDLAPRTPYDSLDKYVSLFDRAQEFHSAIGEASTWYLLSDVAPREILRLQPKARIIIMVRNPVDMVLSLHNQRVFDANENIEDFDVAWRTQDARGEIGEASISNSDLIFSQYRRWGTLGTQVKKWLEFVPKDQIKIILYDDFTKNPGAVYKDVLRFLSLPDDNRREFPRINPSKKKRSHQLALLIRRPPHIILIGTSFIKNLFGIDSLGLRKSLSHFNMQRRARATLSDGMRRELIEAFREEIHLLSQLIGRDLSH